MAVVARVRHLAVRRQVYGAQKGGAVGHSVQPVDAHGHRDRRPRENVEIQHDEGNTTVNRRDSHLRPFPLSPIIKKDKTGRPVGTRTNGRGKSDKEDRWSVRYRRERTRIASRIQAVHLFSFEMPPVGYSVDIYIISIFVNIGNYSDRSIIMHSWCMTRIY